MPLILFIFFLFQRIMILWWQFLFQTHSRTRIQTQLSAHALSHIIYGQICCWRIGFCIIQCRHIIFIAWGFFFRLDVRQFPHMDSLKKNKTKDKKKKIPYKRYISDIWLNAVNDETFHEGHMYELSLPLSASNDAQKWIKYEAYLIVFLLFVSHSPVFFVLVSLWKISFWHCVFVPALFCWKSNKI